MLVCDLAYKLITLLYFSFVFYEVKCCFIGNTLFLDHLNPGIYIATVEALNQVTDFGYSTIRRPNTSAKIYVQEKLLGVYIPFKDINVFY